MRDSRLIQCGVAAGDSAASPEPVHRGRVAYNYIAILASLFLVGMLFAIRQDARARASPAADSAASPEHSAGTANAELAKQSREAAAEDEQAQFKHSWMVLWVAKVTGLSLDNAYWFGVVLNFAIVAGAVVYFSKKTLPGMFRNRTAFIQKAMQEARQASEEANPRLAKIEKRTSRLDTAIMRRYD